MQIKRSVERVPGGMMIVPLFLGAIINTLAPHAAKTFGSFTGALFTGALPILAVFYVCMGSTIEVQATPYAANPVYKPAAASAPVLVATSVVVTALCVPLVTAWWHRRLHRRTPPPTRAVPAASTR